VIKTANLFPKQTKDVDLHVIEPFNESMHLTVYGHPNAGHAFQQLEDPTEGGRRGGVVDVVRHRLVVVGQVLAPSAWCHRVDPPGERHHPQEPLDTAGFFDKPRRDKTQRILETPAAPFHPGLACVGRDDLGISQRAGAAMGTAHTTGVMLLLGPHDRRMRPDVGLDLPCARVDRHARCRAACARLALMVAQVVGVDLVRRPALGQCRERLLGRLRRREAFRVEGQELLVDAASSRALAVWSVASARSSAAWEDTTSQRWAIPSWHRSRG
jgi:hypothetical protein